tara:strand:- start:281 stop:517 length:237 start_codon:yes stop_codon:yes gene_type:complete
MTDSKMDYQVMFNVAIALAGFIGGWVVNRVFALLDRIDADMKSIPMQYVSKEDYREDIREIKEMLGAIFKRLEGKADK